MLLQLTNIKGICISLLAWCLLANWFIEQYADQVVAHGFNWSLGTFVDGLRNHGESFYKRYYRILQYHYFAITRICSS